MIDQRRPRAALRRLDLVLHRINDHDLDVNAQAQMSLKSLAYGARRDAARCALICADHLYNTQQQQQHQQQQKQQEVSSLSSTSSSSWTRQHLPTAINRLKTCLVAAPNESNLLGMLNRAEFLLAEAQQS